MGFYCNNLVSSNYTGDTNATTLDLKDGIVAYYGLSYSLKIYAAVVHELLTLETQNGNNAELAPDSNPNLDSMSWAWQTCTELGTFFPIGRRRSFQTKHVLIFQLNRLLPN
jgi:hypothetical protein